MPIELIRWGSRSIALTLGILFSISAPLAGAAPTALERRYQESLRPTDDRLEQLVQAALAEDPLVESFEIVVTAEDGAVRLNGAVDTEDERARAGSVAEDVEGVAEVENELTVAKPLVAPDRADSDIRRDVLAEVAKEFPGETVEVSVEKGFLTLRGSVSSREVRRRMTEIAFRAGALLVKNQLEVAPE